MFTNRRREKKGRLCTAPLPGGTLLTSASSLGGSGWIDRFDADRSSGSVENSGHLHALVEEHLSLLLIVELISDRAVSSGKDKFVPRLHDLSFKHLFRSCIYSRGLIVGLHGLLLSRRITRGVGSTLRQRLLVCEQQDKGQRHCGQGELYVLHRNLLGESVTSNTKVQVP